MPTISPMDNPGKMYQMKKLPGKIPGKMYKQQKFPQIEGGGRIFKNDS